MITLQVSIHQKETSNTSTVPPGSHSRNLTKFFTIQPPAKTQAPNGLWSPVEDADGLCDHLRRFSRSGLQGHVRAPARHSATAVTSVKNHHSGPDAHARVMSVVTCGHHPVAEAPGPRISGESCCWLEGFKGLLKPIAKTKGATCVLPEQVSLNVVVFFTESMLLWEPNIGQTPCLYV